MAYRGIPTFRKRLVGSHLRRLREDKGLPIETVAAQLGVSLSAAYRQETGNTATSVSDAKAYLDMYEVKDPEIRERIMTLARASRVRGWWFAYGETAGTEHVDLADAEDIATQIRTVHLHGIHALLETEEYAKACLEASISLLSSEGVSPEDALELRNKRRSIMDRKGPPHIWAVIGEAGLQRNFSDPDVMRNQLLHLVELSKRSNVSIQILPSRSLAGLVVNGFFTVMSFGEALEGSVVHADHQFSDHSDQVKADMDRFTHVQSEALSGTETRQHLVNLAASLKTD